MIENSIKRNQRDRQLARRRGVAPSQHLRRHFVSLARQINQWANQRTDGGGCLTVGVTSLTKGAGKSTVSFNLSSSLTTVARCPVLLVESDFGNPYLSRRLGHAKAPGLGEVLLGDVEFAKAVHPTPMKDLSLMSCGLGSDSDSVELPFDLIAPMIEENLTDYGFMIFDLPLANHLTACHSISQHLDGVILTIESSQLERQQVHRFHKLFENQGTEVIGVVINKA